MRNLTGYQAFWMLLVMTIAFNSCRLDDDSSYEIRTYSSFFLVQKPNGLLSIYRYQQDLHQMDSAWNLNANVPDAELSDALMLDNVVWIASGVQKSIFQLSPTFGSVKEKFDNLPIAPHYIAVGEKQVLISDTAAGKIAFVKLRNGDVQEIEFEGKPGKSLYNSGKFYLQVDDSLVAIYDESAMTTRATVSNGLLVDALLLNRYHAIVVISHDSTTTYQVLIDPNSDILIGEKYPVFFTKILPTPYFSAKFGGEFIKDLQIQGGNLMDQTGTILADSIQDFEADFFEGTLFYTRGQDLVVKSIDSLLTQDSLSFQGRMVRSFHQYAAD